MKVEINGAWSLTNIKGMFYRVVWELLFGVFYSFLKYVWVKKCMKMCVMLFKMWKLLFELGGQTVPKTQVSHVTSLLI